MRSLSSDLDYYEDMIESFLGPIRFWASEEYLLGITLGRSTRVRPNRITQQTKEWLLGYLAKKPLEPSIPLLPSKTQFAKKVRESVMAIPFGSCATYGQIAAKAGNPKAARAVGALMRSNPYMILVPCHRVIAQKGLGGYNGGLNIKRRLLEFEECESISL